MKNNELNIEELEVVTGGIGFADPAPFKDDDSKADEESGVFVSIYTNW